MLVAPDSNGLYLDAILTCTASRLAGGGNRGYLVFLSVFTFSARPNTKC